MNSPHGMHTITKHMIFYSLHGLVSCSSPFFLPHMFWAWTYFMYCVYCIYCSFRVDVLVFKTDLPDNDFRCEYQYWLAAGEIRYDRTFEDVWWSRVSIWCAEYCWYRHHEYSMTNGQTLTLWNICLYLRGAMATGLWNSSTMFVITLSCRRLRVRGEVVYQAPEALLWYNLI